MTLEQLKIFVKVVQAGSFTRAAELLEMQKSYVSRVVASLEAELAVKLIERTTRALSVTEVGKEIYERALGITTAVEETSQAALNVQGEPRGSLRLTCGVEFGQLAVGHWVDEYLSRYPDVAVDADYTSRVVDIVHEGFDLAIRIGKLEESRLVARKLGELDYGVFAAPAYLERAGAPMTLDDLRSHSLIMFSSGAHRKGWSFSRAGSPGDLVRFEANARLFVNNAFAVRDAVLHGLGISVLPLLIARDGMAAGQLVPLLPEWHVSTAPVFAVYPSSRYLSPKVRAFVDIARERLPAACAAARRAAEAVARQHAGA